METKAIMFLDYNGTIDDIQEHKGAIFAASLNKFIEHFDGNVEIVIITSAVPYFSGESIRPDISFTLSHFPKKLRQHFAYLIEDNCRLLSKIDATNSYVNFFQESILSNTHGTKKNGVEHLLRKIDPKNEIHTCVFVGDSETSDLVMLDAEIGNRQKIFLLANKRLLKTNHYVYQLSMDKSLQNDHGYEMQQQIPKNTPFIIKTGNGSYGAGKALDAVVKYMEKEKEH